MPALVLIHPDIPQNLGGCLRLSACLNIPLHVIEPCGFPLDDTRLRRAGMDYIHHAELHRHLSWEHFKHHVMEREEAQGDDHEVWGGELPEGQEEAGKPPSCAPAARHKKHPRRILLETDGDILLTDFAFRNSDYLILGSESAGTPRELYTEMDATLRIPMRADLRSLNVAMAAGIACFEAWRQLCWAL